MTRSQRSARERVMWTLTAATLIVVAGCTDGSETPVVRAPALNDASVQPASESPSSKVVFVDVRTRSATPLPTALTTFEEANDFRRSPDGSRFVFGADVADGSSHQLFLGSIDGSDVRQITDEPLAATSGRWSPDGSRIVFLSGGFLLSRLKVIEVATGEVQRIEGVPRGVWEPSFSPDGRSILFSMATRTPQGSWRTDLWTVPVNGGTPTRLLEHGAYGAYSPDGSTIAYHRTGGGGWCGKCWWVGTGLSLTDVDSLSERPDPVGSMSAPPQAFLSTGARWSPGGLMVMHTGPSGVGGRAEIVVRDLRSGKVVRLGTGSWPTWFDDRTVVVTR